MSKSKTKKSDDTEGDPFWDFLTFRLMITPVLLMMVYYVGAVGCLLTGFYYVNEAFGLALLLIFGGPFGLRIIIEIAIVPFRMNETLRAIKNTADKKVEK